MLQVYILAAGKGTRMRSDTPKVLHTIAGKSMLAHVLDACDPLHPQQTFVVVGHGGDQVKAALADRPLSFIEQNQQLGTGHAVKIGIDHFQDDATVLILFGDVPLVRRATLSRLAELASNNTMGLLTVCLDDPSGYGRIVRDSRGLVEKIVEHKDASAAERDIREVNTGIMAVAGRHLKRWLPQLNNNNAQQEFYLPDIVAMAVVDQVEVKTAEPQTVFEVMGVNNRLQQSQLERVVQRDTAERLLTEGVTLMDPARFDCRGTITAGADCVIDINCVFEGAVQLGDGVFIGPNCVIKDAVIGDNTRIEAHSLIDQVTLGDNCQVGPFARLRPGTRLAAAAKIGNFVEIKKTVVGKGSKVNHLSYIGDAELGEGVNIGAGTITCNYDGVNKFQTHIGDGAFVGSNTALVAPVTVGAQATIAAGSTITASVSEQQLAVARQKQRNIDGWQRPSKKK